MDKREEKLRRSLQMVMLRLTDNEVLQRVEIETPKGDQFFATDPLDPQVLHSDQGTQLSLGELPGFLAGVMANAERGYIRFIERGTLVTVAVLANDVKLSLSTLTSPLHQRPAETGTRHSSLSRWRRLWNCCKP